MAPLVVFDCMVFLQAAARKSSVAGACLEMAEQGHIRLCLSLPILAEIHDVLLRPEIRTRFPSLTETLVNEFLASIRRIGSLYPEVGHHFVYQRDPKDEPYLNLAIEARARYLVSRDNDILDLRNSQVPDSMDFRKRFPEIRILEPIEFLREMRLELLRAPPESRPREPGLER